MAFTLHFTSLYFIHCSGLRCVLQEIFSGPILQCLNVTLLENRVFMEEGKLQWNYTGMLLLLLSHFSHIWLFATQWTVACQATDCLWDSPGKILKWVAMLPPGDLPDPGIQTVSFKSPALAGRFLPLVPPVSQSRSVVSGSLQPHGLYSPWNSPGQNTKVGSLSLLQGIFPTQDSNPGLLHCRRILH